jgi:autotransporter-associated beta strand protein
MQRNRVPLRAAMPVVALITLVVISNPQTIRSETWNLGTGGSYSTAGNWSPATVPNGVGASVIFNGLATLSNPDQTANRGITLDGPKTVGSILFNNDLSTFTNTISTGSGGPLTFDAAGAGPATINTTGFATGNNTISVAMVLTDSLSAFVDNTSASSAAGSLNLTAAINGPGGFTKFGDGLATFGTGAKTYTGATVLNGGRMRISVAAQPSMTSSFTINTGAQLTLIATDGAYQFGTGLLTINGSGPTSGSFANFPGAIRQDTDRAYSIGNAVFLQTDSLIHVQGSSLGRLTLGNTVSGPGRLTLTAPGSDANLGTLFLNSSNTYSGGTTVNGGTLVVNGAAASLGTGEVVVNSANLMFGGASAKLTIQTGVVDAIANNATLSLAGGNFFGAADDGYLELEAGINEIVGALLLGGIPQIPGTYGSSASGAMFQSDEYFFGAGILTVVPEPGSAGFLIAGAVAIAGLNRHRRR